MSCPACFSGHVDSGKPTGHIETLHGRETYIATPLENKPAKGIVVIIPDAFGLPFVNNQILADHYAAAGQYKVYLPDFMDGTAAPVSMLDAINSLIDPKGSWLWKPWYVLRLLGGMGPFIYHNRFGVAWPKISSFLQAIRTSESDSSLPVAVAGFCWGGPAVLKLSSDSPEALTADKKRRLADACFTAHPSNLAIPSNIEHVQTNLSIAIGDKDMAFNMAKVEQTKAVLAKLSEVDSEVVVYPGAGHGFAVRADTKNNVKMAEQAEDAEKQAIAWFQKQFAKVAN